MRTSFNTVLFCVILAGLVSCKDGMDNGSNILSFTAERTDFSAPPVKTHLVDFFKVHWNSGDKVAVHADGGSAVLYTAQSDGASTTMTSAIGTNGYSFMMVYPYEASKGILDGKIAFNLPSLQKAYNGTFDPEATVSLASTDNLTAEVVFDNALSLIKFNIPEHLSGMVHTVTFESRSGEPLCGDILCDPSDLSNEMYPGGESHSVVTMKSAPAMTAGDYYIAIRPCTMTTGFRVTALMYDKTYYSRELTYSYTCEDDYIYNIGEVGSPGWYYTSFDYIVTTVSGVGQTRADGGTLIDGSCEQTTWRNVDALCWMPDGSGRIMSTDRGYHYLRIFDPQTQETSTWLTSNSSSYMKVPWRVTTHGSDLYIANKDTDNILKVASDKTVTLIDNDFGETNGIMDVEFDSDGNMYVLDRDNNTIYKYNGTDASSKAVYATLTKPLSMKFLPGDNLLVTDQQNMMNIISTDGTINEFAGSGTAGKADGRPGDLFSAELGYIYDFTIGEDGTIYLSQWNGSLSDQSITTGSNVRMIVPDAYGNYDHASVVTIAGADDPGFTDGIGKEARLKRPYGIITTTDQRTIYFSDEYNYVIRKIDVVPVTAKVRYEDIL